MHSCLHTRARAHSNSCKPARSAGASCGDGGRRGASSKIFAIIALLMGLQGLAMGNAVVCNGLQWAAIGLLPSGLCTFHYLNHRFVLHALLFHAMPDLQMEATHIVFILCSPLLPVAHILTCRGATVMGKRWLLL